MHLFNTRSGIYLVVEQSVYRHVYEIWDAVVNRQGLHDALASDIRQGRAVAVNIETEWKDLLAPVGRQEVWAAGVTYTRSKEARMEESEQSGASRFYDLVYAADRPELFFKCAGWRVAAPGAHVRIRRDSTWNVPEPELTLFVCSAGTIEGYTIGNDMSSRSIEGENPLYLPQAKIFDGSAALGPCLFVPKNPPDISTKITMTIERRGSVVFDGRATLGQMKRSLPELVGWLTRELSFPDGVMLMTGTCVVPGDGFTLQSGDVVDMSIDGIGRLVNPVA